MPMSPTRGIRTFRYAVFFDGIDDYAVISPFIVYGWSEITIQEWVYFYHPKDANPYSHPQSIGDGWSGEPMTDYYSPNLSTYYLNHVRFWACRERGTYVVHYYDLIGYVNKWINVVRRFDSARNISFYVNGASVYSSTIPSDYKTVLEWDPDTATNPAFFKRFVLGAGPAFLNPMKMLLSNLLIYNRALSESELRRNMTYPWNPVRDGLKVWLYAHPDYVKDIDNDGILEWVDLSGNGNHAKLYGATLATPIKSPLR